MKREKVLIFFSLLFAVFLIIGLMSFLGNFSLNKIYFGPEFSPVLVTRVLPDNFVKNEPFNVTLNVEVVGPIEGNVLIGDLAEGAVIVGNNPGALIEEDLIAWVELSPENQSLTYSVVSDRDSLSFDGKAGFSLSPEVEQEVNIGGEDSIAVQMNNQITSDSGVSSGGGGGGGSPVNKNKTTTQNVSEINSFESLFADTEQMSEGDKAIINEKKGEGIFILILSGVIGLIIMGSFVAYYFYRKK